ncbi:hypothetical protein VTK26DRAFT_3077 [Humicola hyalothermophila]
MPPPESSLALRHIQSHGNTEPLSGMVISVVLAMISLAILSALMTQRYLAVKMSWLQLPLVQWRVSFLLLPYQMWNSAY